MKQPFSIVPHLKRPLCSPVAYLLLLLAAMQLCACSGSTHGERFHKVSGEVWHTLYNVTYRGPESLSDSIMPVLDEVGASLSIFDPASLVSEVNHRSSALVDTHFKTVYAMSRRVNEASGGAFDPTLSPLITAWGFGKGHHATADTLRLDSLLAITGIRKTRLSGDSIFKEDPRIEFNLSAVAKGYGADCVAAMFRRNGVTDFLIEIGGEIVASGKNPKGADWRVAVARPVADSSVPSSARDSHEAIIAFTGMGMATSGDYRNFHGQGTARYGHTISPATGRPAATDVASATVMAPTCMEADALATAAMAMGSRKATAMLDSLALPYLLIRTDLSVITSPTMASMLAH